MTDDETETDDDTFTLEVPGMTQERFTHLHAGLGSLLNQAMAYNDMEGVRLALLLQHQLSAAHPDRTETTLEHDAVHLGGEGDREEYLQRLREVDPAEATLDDFEVEAPDVGDDAADIDIE